ncbi:hypothetical protein L915_19325 [Phytophthora nicotianae]|uniref:Uncharacterized protein n=1 Tax=Phytophthora nicotianae TaxID=4792 RepID=W2FSL5_PHYNI|nr:hypothetical protein L915_19325 [Phytophthora nicotianae]
MSTVLEDDSDDKQYAQSFLFPTRGEPSRRHGGSSLERRANKERERVGGRGGGAWSETTSERIRPTTIAVPDEKMFVRAYSDRLGGGCRLQLLRPAG